FTKADACGGAEVQLEERAGGMRQGEKMRGPLTEAERNSRESDDHDAEENGAGDAARHQDGHENKSGGGEKDLWVGSLAQADEGGEAGEQFAAHGGVIFFETKDAVEQTVFPLK